MLKHTPARFALALCCALSLTACSSSEDGAAVSPTAAGYALAAAGNIAIAAAQAAGMTIVPLPSTGCYSSLLDPTKVVELLMTLPEAQQAALATVLDASAGVWTAQLYKGELGAGMCLPVQGALVLLPASANESVDKMVAAVEPLQTGLGTNQ
jgi:hypothetical protein